MERIAIGPYLAFGVRLGLIEVRSPPAPVRTIAAPAECLR
jgi:hypothetical protein